MLFAASERSSIGIETEVYCVEPKTRMPVDRAAEIISALDGAGQQSFKGEFLKNTVEVTSEPRARVSEAVADIRDRLRALVEVADHHNIQIGSSGTHPLALWQDQAIDVSRPRYQALLDRAAFVARQMVIWGLHVHIGVESREKVIPIMAHLQEMVPLFIALSASSPFWQSFDTGYASYRTIQFGQLANVGQSPRLQTWEQYEELLESMTSAEAIETTTDLKWDVRPSPQFGTIEVRAFDAVARLDDVSALAALAQCAVESISRRIDVGKVPPTQPLWVAAENRWRAARYGMKADLIVGLQSTTPLVSVLRDLRRDLEPIARSLGCDRELAGLDGLISRGPGYARQRSAVSATGAVDSILADVRHGLTTW
jgi:glutamate---cysteine ligase / carboxylate-amine ligase